MSEQKKKGNGFDELINNPYYQHQELMIQIKERKEQITIGVPKEIELAENRVALRPEAVKLLVNNGINVLIENGAGAVAKHTDQDYSEAGAQIMYSVEELYKNAEVIIKIAAPTINELKLIPPNRTLFSALQLPKLTPEYLQILTQKKITATAFEFVRDDEDGLPFVRSMSEIAGGTVMLIAAEYLNSANNGKGVMLGGVTGIPPTNVVILGAGTVGEYAARAALGLGANVKVFDNNLYKLRSIKYNLVNPQLFTSLIDPKVLSDAIANADVAIGAIRPKEGRAPCLVSEEMVAHMKPESVIIDVSMDHGGCFETSSLTTHLKPVFKRYGVIHYCVPNIPSRVARTASAAISNIFAPMLLKIQELGSVNEAIFEDQGLAHGVYTYKGEITKYSLAKEFGMRFRDLSILVAARRNI